MRGLDDTDRDILRLLLEDGRRSYSDIAETVGLSAPAVSDRIDRLRELGLIRRFTVDLDRGLLRDGTPVLVTVRARPGTGKRLETQLREQPAVEHLFRTADETLVCTATVTDGDSAELFEGVGDAVRSYDVQLLAETSWTPQLDHAELAPDCVECGNTVDTEGERETFDGTVYHFCCSSCLESFRAQYDRLSDAA
ncbi:DNA-binding transcriptional regulator, Lrp family [Halovenus aranensis]|uniref:DNA-binding transcriptional regulator, Lrp family n=1 Tax=Halovenus aranensis TaxID=890420 RepID=A0A1G8S8V5_9EURY|nr:AsnC family transcriptional regulator [Halovenus aranensis]SDJ25140.1 DNA-binding transcriptional regulator, Lrp family [Halovenus aranensis]